MRDHNLMHGRHVDRGSEDGLGELKLTDNLAFEINFFYYRHSLLPPYYAVMRIITRLSRGAGTEPLISIRLFSSSIAKTERFFVVTRSLPM